MTQVYRDRSGRRLEDYPRPSVAVDVALLTVLPADEPKLDVLQVRGRTSRVGTAGHLPAPR